MDVKLIFNPLYRTAVYADDAVIRAVAMDTRYRVLDRFTHTMSRASAVPARLAYDAIFPFTLHLGQRGGEYLHLSLCPGRWISLVGLGVCLGLYTGGSISYLRRRPRAVGVCLVALTGVFGLIALGFMETEAG